MSLVTRKRIIMSPRERKKSEVGKKEEKGLDLLRAEIKMLDKYFRDVQLSTGKKQ